MPPVIIHLPACKACFVLMTWYVDFDSFKHQFKLFQGVVRSATLPRETQYSTGWATRKITLGEDISAFDFHEKTGFYVIGTSRRVDYKLPEDELHYEWSNEGNQGFFFTLLRWANLHICRCHILTTSRPGIDQIVSS